MKYAYTFLILSLSLTACNRVVYGPQGEQGIPGETVVGPKGDKGDKGDTGEMGPQGPMGQMGEAGQSCSVVKLGSVTNVTCDETTVQVLDGQNGVDATPTQTIALCPEISGGTFKEYLLKIGSDYYGVYASGQRIGLTKLTSGNWVTSDGRNCHFTITANGELQ